MADSRSRIQFRSVWFKLRVGRDRQITAPVHGTRTETSGIKVSGESVVHIISFLKTGNVETVVVFPAPDGASSPGCLFTIEQ